MSDLNVLKKMNGIIESRDNEDIVQGNLAKELNESKKRQKECAEKLVIYGLNYYTKNKISEIAYEAKKYLGVTDIDIDLCLENISGKSDVSYGLISYLVNIEIKILEIKSDFENNTIGINYKEIFTIDGGDSNER